MKLFQLPIIIGIIVLLCTGCKITRDEPPYEFCPGYPKYTTTDTIRKTLIGKWKWNKSQCWSTTSNANKNIIVSFKADFTYIATIEGNTTTGTWDLAYNQTHGPNTIACSPYIENIAGSVNFCDTTAIFKASNNDGCITYFARQ